MCHGADLHGESLSEKAKNVFPLILVDYTSKVFYSLSTALLDKWQQASSSSLNLPFPREFLVRLSMYLLYAVIFNIGFSLL